MQISNGNTSCDAPCHVRCHSSILCTKWVDYVEEPMKYQALRPQFFTVGSGGMGGGGWVVVGWQ